MEGGQWSFLPIVHPQRACVRIYVWNRAACIKQGGAIRQPVSRCDVHQSRNPTR